MERKTFLQLSMIAPLAAAANAQGQNPKKGFKIEAGKDRFQEELHIMGGQFNCVVSGQDTGGELCIYNTFRQEKGGPAFHLHHSQDEWFFVVSGEFIIKIGDDTFHLKAGDSAFAPRTIPHAFAKVNEGDAHMLVLFQPAGTMEDFFKQMSKITTEVVKDPQTRLKELHASHGMQVVGPPLKV